MLLLIIPLCQDDLERAKGSKLGWVYSKLGQHMMQISVSICHKDLLVTVDIFSNLSPDRFESPKKLINCSSSVKVCHIGTQ